MLIVPGQEGVVLSLVPVSIHGDRYVDVVLEVAGPDGGERLSARLGTEAVDDDLAPGDRVQIEGFLRTVTGLRKID